MVFGYLLNEPISDRLNHDKKFDRSSVDINTSFSCTDCYKWIDSSEELNVRQCIRHLISTAQINYF
jgi:hypothetical protein